MIGGYAIYSKLNNSYGVKALTEIEFRRLSGNRIHKKFKASIDKQIMENEFKINFETKDNISEVNVILMPELSESQLDTYLDILNDEPNHLFKYAELLAMISYNQISPHKFEIKKKLNLLLETQSSYWENSSNCKYSLNKKFIEREFSDIVNLSMQNINIINMLDSKKAIDITPEILKGNNYIDDLIRDTKWVELINRSPYFLPIIATDSYESVLHIYKQIPSEFLKYTFIANLLCARTHVHLILNNKELLIESKDIFEKYAIVFKYLIGYAWMSLKNEEIVQGIRMKDTARFIFDIDTVYNLPLYPFTYEDINQNPYACVAIDIEIMNLKKNCMGMDMMQDYKKYYGVCNSQEFEKRLNIFINGKNEKGILDMIDWSHCRISGSAMTACGMKYNPLMDLCKVSDSDTLSDLDIASYFNHYYLDSDVDLICNYKSIWDFLNMINNFINNLTIIAPDLVIESIHTASIIISEELIMYELDELKNVLNNNTIDVDYIKHNFDKFEIKAYFHYKYYHPWKTNQNKLKNMLNNHTAHKLYAEFISKEDFRIYSLNYSIDDQTTEDYEGYIWSKDLDMNVSENDNKIIGKISESIRFKIITKNIKTFEIFKSKDVNFFSMISKFHMGFVRATWNGTTVHCLTSYITSMMIQLTTDYKYFSSIRDPVEIVNKYRSRGWGIILNDKEKVHMANFNSSAKLPGLDSNKWLEIYKIDITNKESVRKIFGSRKSSDDLFKPSKIFQNLPDECYRNVNHLTFDTFDTSFQSFTKPKLEWLLKLKAIGDNGFVIPLDKSVINRAFIDINSQ